MRPNPSIIPPANEPQVPSTTRWNEDVHRVLSGHRPRFGRGRAVRLYLQARTLEELEHVCTTLRELAAPEA